MHNRGRRPFRPTAIWPNDLPGRRRFRVTRRSPHQTLQRRSNLEKHQVETLEQPKDGARPRQQPERTQNGDSAPHRGEGRSAGHDRPVGFPGVESRQQCRRVDRAPLGLARLHEIDATAAIEATHQCDLTHAQRTCPVEPDGDGRRAGIRGITSHSRTLACCNAAATGCGSNRYTKLQKKGRDPGESQPSNSRYLSTDRVCSGYSCVPSQRNSDSVDESSDRPSLVRRVPQSSAHSFHTVNLSTLPFTPL